MFNTACHLAVKSGSSRCHSGPGTNQSVPVLSAYHPTFGSVRRRQPSQFAGLILHRMLLRRRFGGLGHGRSAPPNLWCASQRLASGAAIQPVLAPVIAYGEQSSIALPGERLLDHDDAAPRQRTLAPQEAYWASGKRGSGAVLHT